MRVPLSRVYRAFPELDHFSDQECEALVAAARHRYRAAVLAFFAITVVAVAIVSLAGAVLFIALLSQTRSGVGVGTRQHFELVFMLALFIIAVTLSVAALITRDAALRWVIRRQIIDARCPECAYPLLGLEAAHDEVRCPECGRLCRLAEMGLTEADIIARPKPRLATLPT